MVLSIWKWTTFKDFCLLSVKIANFTVFSSNRFMCNNCSSFDHCMLFISLDIMHHSPFWMPLFVSALDSETESSNNHCKFSNFISITGVLPWSFCLESLFCKMIPMFSMFVKTVVIGCICRYLEFICAESTAWIVEDNNCLFKIDKCFLKKF